MGTVTTLTKEIFHEAVLNTDRLVVIDFWATWCGPCQMLSPVVEEVSTLFDDVKFYKVNVDEQPELTMQFKIKNIPTLVFIKDSKTVDISIGYVGKDELEQCIRRLK